MRNSEKIFKSVASKKEKMTLKYLKTSYKEINNFSIAPQNKRSWYGRSGARALGVNMVSKWSSGHLLRMGAQQD